MSKNKNYRSMYSAEKQEEVVDQTSIVEEKTDVANSEENEVIICPEQCEYVAGIVAGCTKLNVREHPNMDGSVVCVLPAATEVKVCTAHNYEDWYEVCTASGVEGYCMKKFISVKK